MKLGFRLQVIFYTAIVVAIAAFTTAYLAYNSSAKQLEHQVAVELMRIVTTAAPMIKGDLHEEIYLDPEFGLEGKDAFDEIQQYLRIVRDSNEMAHRPGLSPIYTFRYYGEFQGEDYLEFIVMTDADDKGTFYTGAVIEQEEFHKPVLAGKASYSEIYQDQEGHWISAAAPLLDSKGEVVGIIQADRPVEFYLNLLAKIRQQYFAGAGLAVFIGLVLALFFSRLVMSPVSKLQIATEKFQQGKISYRIRGKRSDEFGRLFEAFNSMAESLVTAFFELNEKNKLLERESKELESIAYFARLNPGPVLRFDKSGVMVAHNGPSVDLFNLDHLRSPSIEQLLPEFTTDQLRELIANSASETFEFEKDSSYFQFIIRGVAKFGFANAYGLDITERKRAEQEMLIARTKAEEANRAKAQFLAVMSHELRTPMNSIMGFAEMSLRMELPPKAVKYISSSLKSSRLLLAMINDILDFSKIEAGKLHLEEVNFNLKEELIALMDMFSKNARDKKIEFLVDVEPSVPYALFGDPLRLRQVLINLMSNAIKFTNEGGIIVKVCLVRDHEEEVYLSFSVIDTGIGIAEDKIDHLFEAFTQADSSTTRKYGGTGLGLSIAKKLVELMDGELSVTSEEGKGSCFSFNTKLHITDQLDLDENVEDALYDRHLVYYDESALGTAHYGKVLRRMGAEVKCISNEGDLFKSFDGFEKQGNLPELVVVNWLTDNWQALTACKHLRERFPSLKLLLLACEEPDTASLDYEQSRADDVLLKPHLDITLAEKVLGLVAGKMPTVSKDVTDIPGVVPFASATTERSTSPEKSAASEKNAANAAASKLRDLTILIAEDDAVNQSLLRAFFDELSVDVTFVDNGLEAINKLHTHLYDVLLLDMQMPVMDGYTTATKIREELHLHTLPILALTANAGPKDREKCLEYGCDDYLSKPLDLIKLVQKIELWVEKKLNGGASVVKKEVVGQRSVLKRMPGYSNQGLDKEKALANVGGRQELLVKVLDAFKTKYAEADRELTQLLSANKREEVIRYVHSVKGGGSTIGAVSLYEVASSLETTLKQGGEAEDQFIQVLLREIALCLNEIDEIIKMAED